MAFSQSINHSHKCTIVTRTSVKKGKLSFSCVLSLNAHAIQTVHGDNRVTGCSKHQGLPFFEASRFAAGRQCWNKGWILTFGQNQTFGCKKCRTFGQSRIFGRMPNSLPDTKCFGEIAKYFGENARYLVNNKGFSLTTIISEPKFHICSPIYGQKYKNFQLFHQLGDNFNKLFGNWPDFEPNAKYLAKYQTFGKSQILGNFHQRYLAKPLAGCYGQRFGRSDICFNTIRAMWLTRDTMK